LRTPRDILEKARREHDRLTASVNIDNVFNFFVTVAHIWDYVYKGRSDLRKVLGDLVQDPDIKAAENLCDKGKHMLLVNQSQQSQQSEPTAQRRRLGALNTVPLNTIPLNAFRDEWAFRSHDQTVDILELAGRVLQKWDKFLADNGL